MLSFGKSSHFLWVVDLITNVCHPRSVDSIHVLDQNRILGTRGKDIYIYIYIYIYFFLGGTNKHQGKRNYCKSIDTFVCRYWRGHKSLPCSEVPAECQCTAHSREISSLFRSLSVQRKREPIDTSVITIFFFFVNP